MRTFLCIYVCVCVLEGPEDCAGGVARSSFLTCDASTNGFAAQMLARESTARTYDVSLTRFTTSEFRSVCARARSLDGFLSSFSLNGVAERRVPFSRRSPVSEA